MVGGEVLAGGGPADVVASGGVGTAEKLSFSTPQKRSQCLVVVCMVLFVFVFLPLICQGFELICPGRRRERLM